MDDSWNNRRNHSHVRVFPSCAREALRVGESWKRKAPSDAWKIVAKDQRIRNRFLSDAFAWTFFFFGCVSFPAFASEPEQTFGLQCAGCHAGGGNIVDNAKTLRISDLQKYGLDSVEELYDIIYYGRGRMPGYGEGCQGKIQCTFGTRLNEEEVKSVAGYVLDKARANWD